MRRSCNAWRCPGWIRGHRANCRHESKAAATWRHLPAPQHPWSLGQGKLQSQGQAGSPRRQGWEWAQSCTSSARLAGKELAPGLITLGAQGLVGMELAAKLAQSQDPGRLSPSATGAMRSLCCQGEKRHGPYMRWEALSSPGLQAQTWVPDAGASWGVPGSAPRPPCSRKESAERCQLPPP